MEVQIKDLEKSQKQIEVQITKEEFNVFVEKAYKKVGVNMEMKGFRKGNVPRDIIEENIGKEGLFLIKSGSLKEVSSAIKLVHINLLAKKKGSEG